MSKKKVTAKDVQEKLDEAKVVDINEAKVIGIITVKFNKPVDKKLQKTFIKELPKWVSDSKGKFKSDKELLVEIFPDKNISSLKSMKPFAREQVWDGIVDQFVSMIGDNSDLEYLEDFDTDTKAVA